MSEKALYKHDDISSYPDDTISDWLEDFNELDSESLYMKGCPFSFYEVRKEYLRRDFLKGIKEGLTETQHKYVQHCSLEPDGDER